jgi:hypothetical protein
MVCRRFMGWPPAAPLAWVRMLRLSGARVLFSNNFP